MFVIVTISTLLLSGQVKGEGWFENSVYMYKCNEGNFADRRPVTLETLEIPSQLVVDGVSLSALLRDYQYDNLSCKFRDTKIITLDFQSDTENEPSTLTLIEVYRKGYHFQKKRAEKVQFTRIGQLEYHYERYNGLRYCISGISSSKLELRVCPPRCTSEAVGKYAGCVPKCCSQAEVMEVFNQKCHIQPNGPADRVRDHHHVFHTPIKKMGRNELEDQNVLTYTHPNLDCGKDKVLSKQTYTNILGVGKGYCKRLLLDGRIVYRQDPWHWRSLELTPGQFCVNFLFTWDEKAEVDWEDKQILFSCVNRGRTDNSRLTWPYVLVLFCCITFLMGSGAKVLSLSKNAEFWKRKWSIWIFFLDLLLSFLYLCKIISYFAYPFYGSIYKPTFGIRLLDACHLLASTLMITAVVMTTAAVSLAVVDNDNQSHKMMFHGIAMVLVLFLHIMTVFFIQVLFCAPSKDDYTGLIPDDCPYFAWCIITILLLLIPTILILKDIRRFGCKRQFHDKIFLHRLGLWACILPMAIFEMVVYWGFGTITPEWGWILLHCFYCIAAVGIGVIQLLEVKNGTRFQN